MSIQIFPYASKFKENVEVPNAQNVSHAANLGQVQAFLVNKLDASDLDGFVYNVTYNSSNHVLTFFKQNSANVVIDLPIEQLIKGVQLVGNDLEFTFEDGSVVTAPLNSLVVGVVKSVNGQTPDSLGEVTLPALNLFGGVSKYFEDIDVSSGGNFPTHQAFFNLMNPGTSTPTVGVGDHNVHGARLIIQSRDGFGFVNYTGKFIVAGVNVSAISIENGKIKEFVWNVNRIAWIEVF